MLVAVLILVGPPVLNAMLDQPGWPILIGIFVATFVLGIVDARLHRFNLGFALLAAIAYLLAMLLFFNDGTWIYLPVVLIVAAVGSALGDPQGAKEQE